MKLSQLNRIMCVAFLAVVSFEMNDANAIERPLKRADVLVEVLPLWSLPQSDASFYNDVKLEGTALKIARKKRRRVRPKPKPEEAVAPAEESIPLQTNSRRPSRVDFDERLIKGETNKADAIYLFERRSSGMRSLVKKRREFHTEIDESLL